MSYGTVRYEPNRRAWEVTCVPHVAMRLKRVFAGLGKAARDKYYLSDTIENARDLVWFTERYPLDVADKGRLAQAANEYTERTNLVHDLLANRVEANAFDLAVPAREYQRVAASMLLARTGLLLADDVGIGKTCSAICTLTDPKTLPALIVTLTHLPRQWEMEINKFAPSLRVHIVKTGKVYDMTAVRKRKRQLSFNQNFPDVVIINYHKLSSWAETLAPVCRSVVYDEVQELRKRDSNKYRSAKYLSSQMKYRMGLSATPIYNYGAEMYSVLDCLFPGGLGSLSEFTTEWCNGYGEKVTNPKAFSSYLRDNGMMLRRTRSDVGRELPEVSRIVHHIDSDTVELDKVSSSCAELARMILAHGEAQRGDKMRASEELSNALRQATGIAKAPYVAEFVKLLLESEQRIVVFAWHREVYSILLDRLKEFHPVMYTGTESPQQKEHAKELFTKGDSRVLLISLRSGAGLDGLQSACRTAVFAELDWSPGVHEQNVGRIHRDGQPEPVMAYFLVADEGSDPIVCDVLGLKRQQIEAIRDPSAELVEMLSVDEDRIKKLAAHYLKQIGESIPMEATA